MKKINPRTKELKSLAKRLSLLLEKGLDKSTQEVKLLVQHIKFVLSKSGLRTRQVRRIFGAAAIVLGLGFTQNVHAQAAFAAPITNPFGLTSVDTYAAPAAADFDNDGDLDLLVEETLGEFKYYQNTGTSTAPTFAAPITNPFGLTATVVIAPEIAIIDLDNDGDLDIISTAFNGATYAADIVYYQNTGTASAPAFAAPTTNPFGLVSSLYYNAPQFVDIDNDGDFDLIAVSYNSSTYAPEMRYQENTGTAASPAFAAPVVNPFGLVVPSSTNFNGFISFADLDLDGDFDAMYGDGYDNGNFSFMENTGSATAPSFATAVTNPFGLVATNASATSNFTNNPTFLDLDGDGDVDILSGEYGGALIYFENNAPIPWPVAVNELERIEMKVYPNPVTNAVIIESDIKIESIDVLDNTGKIIEKIKQPEETISLRNLPVGIYNLNMKLENGKTAVTRITKQ